ncbi:hypothetical protein [Arthrobacter sp. H41]|uniref:hypothetical protein n=1 Tax=Arthrobacter sp. H41 TaxID=1312978 RepID=UPI00047C78C9|nr:hypothetical protein [Arthrobacter sp. H41]
MASIQHFLLVFDHRKDELVDQISFGEDAQAATAKYGELEKQYRNELAIDIVLVGSDSIETVQVTHANYFSGMSRQKVENVLSGVFG